MDSEKAQHLRESVRIASSAAAERSQEEHAFPVGQAFAESLGYPLDLLATIPSLAVDAFEGVSKVAVFADILPSRSWCTGACPIFAGRNRTCLGQGANHELVVRWHFINKHPDAKARFPTFLKAVRLRRFCLSTPIPVYTDYRLICVVIP